MSAGLAELAGPFVRQPIRDVPDEFSYTFKCKDLAEIIGKLGECFLRMFSMNYDEVRESMA
jgi:hypothetical protein